MTPPSDASQAPLTLGEASRLAGGRLEGDPDLLVTALAPVEEARCNELAFLAAKRYTRYARGSAAGAFLVSRELEAWVAERPRVVVEEPHRALVLLLRRLHPQEPRCPAVHPTAVLGAGASLGAGVSVGPYAVVDEDAQVGDGTSVGAHAVVGARCRVGRRCTLHPQVVLYPGTVLGDGVIVHSGTVLGADGFGYAWFDGAHQRIPHVGRVVLGDDVEIGANAAVDRGSIGDTVVGRGTKVDNLVQIAHNVRLGEDSLLAGMVGIAGSARIGGGVWMGGQAGVGNHVEIGDGARLAAAAKALRDVPAGETVSGNPARPHREELQRQAHLGRLPGLLERVEALEVELAALRKGRGSA
jgi:UDP-3-O-[3-hydroxymyristoyl] glucosamine N-acyltransferase